MAQIRNISAVLFDMDGTLVDSEPLTEAVIRAYCREAGIAVPALEWSELHGVSWSQIAAHVAAGRPEPAHIPEMARRLHELFERMCAECPPAPVPGAREALIGAHARMPTAIVSSSYRESIDATIRRMDLAAYVTCRAGADDYANPKPAPDGFLHAASVLGVPARSCLVFEDSLAGIESARAAGMAVVAITQRSNTFARAARLADRAIEDFEGLERDFFDEIRRTREND